VTQPALWLLSLQAFAAVAVLLTLLALAVQLLTVLFRPPPAPPPAAAATTPTPVPPAMEPQGLAGTVPPGAADAAWLAAVHAAAQRARPGARVVRIEELR
jgi:hypothetical protein